MSASYVIKIYLPDTGRPGKFLYGYKKTEAKVKKVEGGSKTVVSYFFLTSSDKAVRTTLPILGFYGNDDIFEVNLIADDSGEFMKVKLNNGEFKQNYRVLMFHYDRQKFLNSFDEAYSERALKDNCAVYIAQSLKSEHKREHGESYKKKVTRFSHRLLLAFASVTSTILKPLSFLFNNTVTYRHCCNWRQCLVDERSHNGFIVLDVLLGIALFLLMSHVQHTGRYFMLFTELIVNKLRALLEMLDGSPAGLKLNVQLNNFLLSCFMYHVDLWWNFIRIVEPAIHYIFYPITAFGLMGFSFQCAMLCDVVTLITLHAHCFYIYAAMLYKLELYSIRALLRIVLGRRLNVLKNRVESQSYSNRQLFLATLFFTTLLFLLPTVIIYYLVFASLRLLIYCVSFVLMSLQYKILTFPFYKYLRWITGSYFDASNISVDLISQRESNGVEVLEFNLTLNSCVPWKRSPFVTKAETQLVMPVSIGKFAKYLFEGEMMSFLPKT